MKFSKRFLAPIFEFLSVCFWICVVPRNWICRVQHRGTPTPLSCGILPLLPFSFSMSTPTQPQKPTKRAGRFPPSTSVKKLKFSGGLLNLEEKENVLPQFSLSLPLANEFKGAPTTPNKELSFMDNSTPSMHTLTSTLYTCTIVIIIMHSLSISTMKNQKKNNSSYQVS